MSSGADYQARVSAWWCCHILLQSRFSDRYALNDNSYAEQIYCETDDYVDDIRVEFSDNVRLYAQCKTRLSFSELLNSDWADVITQFYNQFLKETAEEKNFRMVLYLKRFNRNWRLFSDILNRYRQYSNDVNIITICRNQNEEQIVRQFNNLLNELEADNLSEINSVKNKLLHKIYIENLTLQENAEDFLLILNNLSNNILRDPNQSRRTWAIIKNLTDNLHAESGTTNRNDLRTTLKRRELELKFSLNFRNDIMRIQSFTQEIFSQEIEKRTIIKIGDDSFTIQREVISEMIFEEESYLIIGDAGVGKTGVLLNLGQALNRAGKCVWFWPASFLKAETLVGLQTSLSLENSWGQIFTEVDTSKELVLIIDGLDTIKDHNVKRAYLQLIKTALLSGIQVIASIRSFDLRYSFELHDLFKNNGEPLATRYVKEEFNLVNHFHITLLNEDEFNQVREHFSEIDNVSNSCRNLLPIISNLFSLYLLCNIISDDNIIQDLSETHTQAQLFDVFWDRRVNASQYRVQIINSLREQIDIIVENNRLEAFNPEWTDELHNYLCSNGILREYSQGSLAIPGWVEFSHSLIFDYCAEFLFIRNKLAISYEEIITDIQANETWTLFLRPSLRLFYFRLFKDGTSQFWRILLDLERNSAPLIQKYLAYLTIAENTFTFENLNNLLGGLSNQSQFDEWVNIIKGVINAAIHSVLPALFKTRSGDWWLSFSFELIQLNNEVIKEYSKRILFVASDNHKFLSEESLSLFNRTSRYLIEYYWENQLYENPIIRLPIKWICESISSHRSDSIEVLRQLITNDELRRSGYNQAFELTRNIHEIWHTDPSFAVEVYDRYTSYIELDEASTPMNLSQILSLTSNKRQQYKSGYYNLTEKYAEFLSEHPVEATRSLCITVKNYLSHNYSLNRTHQFRWKSQQCTITSDLSNIWDFNEDDHREEVKMLRDWEQYLRDLPLLGEAIETYNSIEHTIITQNELAVIWRRLLRAGCQDPSFYTSKLFGLLKINRVLIQTELRESIEDCLELFTPFLSDNDLNEIISSIFNITIDDAVIDDPVRIADLTRNIKLDYLICIPQEYRSEEVIEYLGEYSQIITQRRRHERPIARITTLSPDEFRRLEGIDIDSSQYRELINLSAFLNELNNDDITQENYQDILERVYSVESRLIELRDDIEPELYSLIKNKIFSGFEKITASNITLTPNEIDAIFMRFNTELRTSRATPTDDELTSFDRNQAHWASDDFYASKGIIQLSLKITDMTDDIRDSLRSIAIHPKPIIRANLGIYIWRFIEIWPDIVWNTLERWVSELETQLGLIGIFRLTLFSNHGWFWILQRNDEERTISFLNRLRTSANVRQANEILNHCGQLVSILYYNYDEGWAESEINSALENFRMRINEVEGILEYSLKIIFPRSPLNLDNIPLLQKAQRYVVETLQKCFQNIPTEEPEDIEENHDVLRKIMVLYSRTVTEFRLSAEKQSEYWVDFNVSNSIKESWWAITEPALEQLVLFPHPRLIHDVIQGLQLLIDTDLVKSINWLRKFTVSGASMGISNEHLIVDKTMAILERVLTEHSDLIILNTNFRDDFFTILEVFLVNGWPKAIQLVINLDSIYR